MHSFSSCEQSALPRGVPVLPKKNVLITGKPGSGKTTLVRRILPELAELDPQGFYTEEIRERGDRKGFLLVGLDGRTTTLAHVTIRSPFRVGKYHVDIAGFEAFLRSLPGPEARNRLIVIDEIGKMECQSSIFRPLVAGYLDSRAAVLATIALKGDRFIEEVKTRQDCTLLEINPSNRDFMPRTVVDLVRGIVGAEPGSN